MSTVEGSKMTQIADPVPRVETPPSTVDGDDKQDGVFEYMRAPTPGPPKSDIRARIAFVKQRIEELLEDADDCGCDTAIGRDEDGEIRHYQLDCAYVKLQEYEWELQDLKSTLRQSRKAARNDQGQSQN